MANEVTSFEGGCRCGQIRYTCSSTPTFTAHCHCRDCQYAAGGGFSTIVVVATSGVEMSGDLGGFTVTAESGNELTRKFCSNCGTPILTEMHSNPQFMVLKAGTLDDPSWLEPSVHIWTSSGQPWSESIGELPRFEKSPN